MKLSPLACPLPTPPSPSSPPRSPPSALPRLKQAQAALRELRAPAKAALLSSLCSCHHDHLREPHQP